MSTGACSGSSILVKRIVINATTKIAKAIIKAGVASAILVSDEQLEYTDESLFYDGVKLEVLDKYLVPVLEEGMVTYIGEKENIPKILDIGDFYYRWDDGWTACVSVTKMSAPEARKLKEKSGSFCGYDWMVDSILNNCSIKHR